MTLLATMLFVEALLYKFSMYDGEILSSSSMKHMYFPCVLDNPKFLAFDTPGVSVGMTTELKSYIFVKL